MESQRMLQAVIFDMDGTLVDSEPTHKLIERELFDELGITVSEEEHESYTGTTLQSFWRSLKERHGIAKPVDELIAKNKQKYLQYIRETKGLSPTPGVIELLQRFQESGIPLALATSASREVKDNILKAFELEKFFPIQKCADDVLNGKPNPEIFLKAAEGLNIGPHRCIVFEDADNGIRAAKGAGMKAVGYTNGGRNAQNLDRADLVIDRFDQVDIDALESLWHT